jgi:hypothetical protein
MAKQKTAGKDSVRRGRGDTSDTYGVRGAGRYTSKISMGMQLNEADLLFAVKREPVCKRVVLDVAYDIFSKGFRVEEVSENPDLGWSREVSKVLDGLNARSCLTQLVELERLFGWSILALTYVDYGDDASKAVKNPREIRELLPLSTLQCTVQSSDEEKNPESSRFGLPELYTVRRSGYGVAQEKIHFSRVIHCATRLLDHPWKGVPVLEVMFDDQVIFRNTRWGLGETIVRNSAGFADITVKDRSKKKLDEFEAQHNLHDLNARSYFLHSDDSSISWVGASGKALNPEPYVTPTLESLSCGSRIPLSHLRGATAGTLAGSEVNDREYWGGIAALQALYETVIWELVDRLIETGQIRRVNDYRVVWPAGFELSESAKADIALRRAQAYALETDWRTIDEIRAEEGLDELPDGQGKMVLGLERLRKAPSVGSGEVGSQIGPLRSQLSASKGSGGASSDEADLVEGFFKRFLSRLRRKKEN